MLARKRTLGEGRGKEKLEEMEERKHGGMEGWREGQGLSKRRGREAGWLQVTQR